MKIHYERNARGFEAVCTINPRVLQDEMEKKVESEKLTTVNICLTILALFHVSELREDDFYVTTTSRGRRNYHLKVNTRTLNSIRRLI